MNKLFNCLGLNSLPPFPNTYFPACFAALAPKLVHDDENADLHFVQPLAHVERAAHTLDGTGGGGQAGWQAEGAQHHRSKLSESGIHRHVPSSR